MRNDISIALDKTSESDKRIQEQLQTNDAATLLIDSVEDGKVIIYGATNQQRPSRILHERDLKRLWEK